MRLSRKYKNLCNLNTYRYCTRTFVTTYETLQYITFVKGSNVQKNKNKYSI